MADPNKMPSKEKIGFRKTALKPVAPGIKPARKGMTAGYPPPKGKKP